LADVVPLALVAVRVLRIWMLPPLLTFSVLPLVEPMK